MHSDFSLLDSTAHGTSSQPLADIAPAVGAVSSAPLGGFCKQTLTDEDREAAICRASALVEFFYAEARLYEALWRAHSDFGHKAAYDLAYSNSHKARELMESLIRGRSAAFVAFLEKQRVLDLPACANEERSA